MIKDAAEIRDLRDAYQKIRGLEAAAIERGRVFLELMGRDAPYSAKAFKNGDGFSVKANLDTLLDEDVDEVHFVARDVQGGGMQRSVYIPRAFLFGDETEEEREMAEFRRLSEKYGPKVR